MLPDFVERARRGRRALPPRVPGRGLAARGLS